VTLIDESPPPSSSGLPPAPRATQPRPAAARSPVLWGARLLLIIAGLAAWFATQHLIGTRTYTGVIGDGLLDLLAPFHHYLETHIAARNALLISSSAVIDALTLFLFGISIFGKTLRPFLGLLILFALRQIFQGLCVLPMPEGMIWPKEGPGFPSLFVTYGVSNDLFFSGHTAMAVYGAVEIVRAGATKKIRTLLLPLATAIALFEIVTVLALRAHWTMDVYAGLISALLIAILAKKIAPPIDRLLNKLTGRPAQLAAET
jgi:hypothetical protein